MRSLLLIGTLLLAPVLSSAQDATEVRKWFEAGQYDQVVDAGQPPHAAPDVIFLAGQAAQKQGNNGAANELYQRLTSMPDDSIWHFIGDSATKLVGGDTDGARESAAAAVEHNGNSPEAQYQLGLVLAKRQEWAPAAAAFDRAAQINPAMAYAHYYGGLMFYRANRPDKMANHFEYFLKLAPNAPEQPEVMTIMKTVRGR